MREIDLSGKKAVLFGVANDKSLAWAIAKVLQQAGCQIALVFQKRNKEEVEKISAHIKNPLLIECDVRYDESLDACFNLIKKEFKTFDFLIHSIAFTKKENLRGKYFDVSREGYNLTQETSAYSLVAMVKRAYPIMNKEGSIIALTTIMADRVFPNYNVMGVAKAALNSSIRYLASDVGDKNIRVNGISAGPIATSAANAIDGFDTIIETYREKSPLKKDISQEDVADAALFLTSDLSKNITGQLLLVDAGYHMMGM